MKVLLVTRSAQGAPARRTVSGEWLRVGRNASCEIHLPDPRVALEQGMVVNREGLVYIEGEGGSQDITRKSVRAVRLKPGEAVAVGPYRLEALPAPPGYDGAIAVERSRPAEAAPAIAGRFSQLTLGSLGLTKRWAAWTWALVVLALFVALPLGRVLDLPWRAQAEEATIGERFWNPGPLLLAHQPIEHRCGACHEKAFERVKDSACLECHGKVGHHVGPRLQPAALFEGARCASCHRDHKGVKPTHRDDDGFCISCHADLRARAPDSHAADASDFARDHPAFRLTVAAPGGSTRVRQGEAAPTEPAALAFPHAAHLDPKGVRSPDDGRVKLDCADCHQPEASGRSFAPISMDAHCRDCHRLRFEPAVTTREVPHGDPAQAVTVIEEFYAHLALQGVADSFQKAFGVPGEGLLRRVGEPTASQREAALALARGKARRVAAELVEVRTCKTCHEVRKAPAPRGAAPRYEIAPVEPAHRWMPHARFDHRTHRQAPCADCHDVARSKQASDVAMPAIAGCRECHGGAKPVQGKVTSSCLLCHGFHEAGHPWDPHFQPGKAQARVARGQVRAP